MMNATLKRTYTPTQTEGLFKLFDESGKLLFTCHSLELPNLKNQRKISCISEGVYVVRKHTSPSKGLCFSLPNVPFRDNILIHSANYVGSKNPATGHSDLLGCISLGTGYADLNGDGIKDIINSKATMKKLLALTDEFNLQISS